MRIACSWCGKALPDNPSRDKSLESFLSHSICLFCMQKMNLFDEINGSIPYGLAVIDKDNKITSFETVSHISKNGGNSNILGKDYFEDFNPSLSVKSLKYKLSGLRRRKNDGQLELQYIISDNRNIHFTSVELTHFKNSGDTLINIKLIKKEEI
ncbi:MAG: hypothetical protein ACXAC2_12520 [Candidatus Kariarchaeaceae archaeon]|jgi:hypothetical protein